MQSRQEWKNYDFYFKFIICFRFYAIIFSFNWKNVFVWHWIMLPQQMLHYLVIVKRIHIIRRKCKIYLQYYWKKIICAWDRKLCREKRLRIIYAFDILCLYVMYERWSERSTPFNVSVSFSYLFHCEICIKRLTQTKQ